MATKKTTKKTTKKVSSSSPTPKVNGGDQVVNTKDASTSSLGSDNRARFIKNVKQQVNELGESSDKPKKTKRKPILERRRLLLEKKLNLSGYDPSKSIKIATWVTNIAVLITVIISLIVVKQYFYGWQKNIALLMGKIFLIWALLFIIIVLALWLLVFFYFELKIYNRQKSVEQSLPEFLQLTSSNIRSGMTIDMALWNAVKPKFGVLSSDIELVAKEVMAGAELTDALKDFATKYDSATVQRTVSLIVEGIRAGGEIGDLLNQISLDLTDSQIMKKEMSSDVTTYVIFIAFATILGAPFLFGLAYNLIDVVQSIMGSIDMPSSGASMGGMSLGGAGGEEAINLGDFRIFAVIMLVLSSTMSSLITAVIMKGNVKESVRYIPIYILVSVSGFFITAFLFGKMMGGLI